MAKLLGVRFKDLRTMPGNRVDSFKPDELRGKYLIDLVGVDNRPKEREIMVKWMDYFKSLDVPFIVMLKKGRLRLWKEVRVREPGTHSKGVKHEKN